MAAVEPQSANDYDDRTSAAVKSVLVEIGQTLGSFEGKFALVGGAVPWLLLSESDMRHQMVAIGSEMPDGGHNRVHIAVASIPALLAMKGYAIANRQKPKDAYDIYFCIRNFPDGLDALVAATTPLLDVDTARKGYLLISGKFRDVDDFGPTSVRQFVEGSDALGERTADQWQQDAFGQVNAWLTAIGLRGGP